MLLASFFSWWYGAGWRLSASKVMHRLARTSEFFSLRLLLRTLFSPYRQISAGAVKGNITIQFKAFIDRTVSRFVGFFVRSVVLFMGTVSVVCIAILGILWLVVWVLMPAAPIIGIVLALMGWPQ